MVDYSFQIHTESIQSPPEISNLQQFRQFGVDPIAEGATFVGNAAVFKAGITDADSAQVKLEVELKPVGTPFDGTNATSSAFTQSGIVEFAHNELIPKDNHYQSGGNVESFHWRARAVDAEGNTSEWVEHPSSSNTDFTAKVVPLWTQKISDFPSGVQTNAWAGQVYANGTANKEGDCGLTIAQCGCAITSAIMIANYLGVKDGIDGLPMNPLSFNNWLLVNSAGFRADGSFAWSPMETYSAGQLVYRGDKRFDIPHDPAYQNTASDFSRINEFVALSEPVPVIGKSAGFKNHGGIFRTHFFVVDSKLGTNYTVRDPFWFATQTLDDPATVQPDIRKYDAGFDGLRIYEKASVVALVPWLSISLGSPAELVFTDAQGRRLGKDPRTGEVFNEIPEGYYALDDRITDPSPNALDTYHEPKKTIYVRNPVQGAFTLQVIGTGAGGFSLTSDAADISGVMHGEVFHASTSVNQVTTYQGMFSPASAASTTIEQEKSVLDLFRDLRVEANSANITPSLLKKTILATIATAEGAYKRGKIGLCKLTLTGLAEIIKSKKGKGVPPVNADAMLRIISEIRALL